ncbi:T9SS type A sorting domain-containing protein [Tamlana sp. s12]|uniref:T9SS type A sorting domain-containing protein n=1 Tax=Tamlana sp. s12 TaxID=1630406 RepID=UPI0008393CD8|nr:T9SS type A sorting domain-containing protein [Tamlana sp. s12]QQY83756.1 T9SS type A sorting domain-containing protein [Tamlana sp. s12]
MKHFYKNYLLLAITLTITGLTYAQNSAVFTDNRTGSLGEVPFKIDFTEKQNSTYESQIITENLDIYYFRAARLSSIQPVFNYPYEVYSNFSVTFEKPIENLKLYLVGTRPVDIKFNHPFGFAEGAYNVTATSETQIQVKYPGYAIIEFTEPVTTLTFTPLSVPGSGYQSLTFTDGDSLLGIDDILPNVNNLSLYPNPSSDFIQVSGLNKTVDYRIYSVLGSEVGSGTVFENKKIGIANLINGIYFLKLESGHTIKFVKK